VTSELLSRVQSLFPESVNAGVLIDLFKMTRAKVAVNSVTDFADDIG
jgi:hypothetical protein